MATRTERGQFGRTRRYKFHLDQGQHNLDASRPKRHVDDQAHSGSNAVKTWLKDNPHLIMGEEVLYAKAQPNFNDPRIVFYVLDAIVKSPDSAYIRPTYVSDFLRGKVPLFYWEPGTVGRVIAGIWRTVIEVYGVPNVVDTDSLDTETWEEDADFLPFSRGRDSRGVYYVIDPKGGDEGYLFLLQARKAMFDVSHEQMLADQRGAFRKHFGDENQPTSFYMKHFGPAVRTKNAYQGQLVDPDHADLPRRELDHIDPKSLYVTPHVEAL